MNSKVWRIIQREWAIWRVGALPGLLVIALIVMLRLTGSLQLLEWWVLDYFLKSRPAEPIDERILLVEIDAQDVQAIGTYPIPDADLATLFETLQRYQPRAIGLDIVRDLSVPPGHDQLMQQFRNHQNIIGIEKALAYDGGNTIAPPPDLPPEQVGFADTVLDPDSALRRSLLATHTLEGDYKISFALRLAMLYLADEGYYLANGIRDPAAMRFGETELSWVFPNSGGYVNADAGGEQILINYRSGKQPFRIVAMQDVLQGTVPVDWIRDRVILIGLTSGSGDSVRSSAVESGHSGLLYGVETHAHVVSQIVSAVLDDRPLLTGWAEGWEYLWIVGWGMVGILFSRLLPSPGKTLLGLGVASLLLVGICYGLLLLGWWVPVVPALGVLVLNSAGLTTAMFYRYQQTLKARIADRQFVIEQTFDAIHNGPLQTLARLLRDSQDQTIARETLYTNLKHLNQELRAVYEAIQQETLAQRDSLYLHEGAKLELQAPTHELLHEVYRATLNRDFPCFKTLKVKVVAFEDIDRRSLSPEQKRGLCRFLEEALCNAGKYATGMTRLEVICRPEKEHNVIRVIDNGSGVNPATHSHSGRGTQQAMNMARQLRGTFRRIAQSPQGTRCELTYPIAKGWFW